MADYAKPLPVPDPDTAPFWDGCRAHELRAQRCRSCGRLRWPPRGICPHCQSWEHEWTVLPRRGAVASFVAVHRATNAAFASDVPYVIAQVLIDGTDGRVRMLSNVIGCAWDAMRVGMPVEVVFEDVTPEATLPKFRPA